MIEAGTSSAPRLQQVMLWPVSMECVLCKAALPAMSEMDHD